MIATFIIALFSAFLVLVNAILDGFNYIMPQQITDAITYFAGYLNYLKGILPIGDILLAFISFLTFWGLVYIVKLLFMFLSSIPFLHLNFHLPQHELGSEEVAEHNRFNKMMRQRDGISRYTK